MIYENGRRYIVNKVENLTTYEYSDLEKVKDPVNHPSHYNKHPSMLEPIIVCRHLSGDLANFFKYTVRYLEKEKPIEDLKKCIYYLDDYKSSYMCINENVQKDVLNKILKFIVFEENNLIRQSWYFLYQLLSEELDSSDIEYNLSCMINCLKERIEELKL